MIYVGTDIAKLNHFTTAISSDDEILVEPSKFFNSYDDFYLLLFHLAPLDQNGIIIGLESTAYHGDNPVRFLISKGFKACVLGPIQTSLIHKNSVRRTKTDEVDMFVIAKTLMMQSSLRSMTLEDLDYIELKELGRFRQRLVKQCTRLKIQLTSYVNQAFPELQYFFKSSLHRNSVYAILKEAPTPNAIASVHSIYPTHTLKVVSYGHLGKDKARELGALAQKFAGINDSSLSIQITHTIEQVRLLDSRLFSTELEMANLVTCLHSVVMTISGIGVVNDGVILGEIGDIYRFSNPKKLLVLAGLDPTVYRSGNFQAHRTKMSKRESKVSRYTLMNVVHNVIKNNVTFKAYYDVKRTEGRTRYNTLGHCASKPIRVTWKMFTDRVALNFE